MQNPFIRYAVEAGWTYLPPEEALRLRGGEDCPILRRLLVEGEGHAGGVPLLQRLNPGVVNSVGKAEEVVNRIIRVRPNIEGNLEAWEYLKGLKTVFVEAERRERNLRLLDPDHPGRNVFHVTEEFRFVSGQNAIRADVVLLINGIPVIVVETKAATKIEGIAEAFDQIRRYHREGPELMAQAQLFALTHLMQFFYGPTWSLSRKALFNWREAVGAQHAVPDFETLVKSFLAPQRVLRVLTEFILFVRKDGDLTKVILRPHQMRATERVIGRARDPEKRRGLIWHTQGSGKTYTMITVAKRLLEDPYFENPIVLMIVDRNELQQQLFQNLESVGFSRVHLARSKHHLRKLLRQDTRGLIVSMIHKFDKADAGLNTRTNIFVLVDEAHRTTGGDLGNFLMGALPNATYIGFTGTPIDKTSYGRGTFKTFGTDDHPTGDLDKYSIRESIEDGTTVPIHYAMAPNELQPDRNAMEQEFWQLAELEGVSDVEELNRVLDRAVTLKNMLKNPARVSKVAAFVASHFRETVQPMGYKAFLVGVDREACALYKEALDRYLEPDESEVVISRGPNDPPHIARYHLSQADESEIRKAFRKPDRNPKILIVTEKLLTGYDAPILYCMYLDKPMRDHVLLQAIARVNRPYEDREGMRKTSGLIIDFVGIFDNLERALAFDSKDIAGVMEGLDVLKRRFTTLMEQGKEKYLPLVAGKGGDKAAEALLEHFRDHKLREEFYRYFRELEEIYEILSPDPFLRPYLESYQKLVTAYRIVRAGYEPHIPVDKSFLRKTAQLVQEHTETTEIRDLTGDYELTADVLNRLLTADAPDTVRVFNLVKALYKLVAEKGKEEPYLIPIGERAREIAHRFEERQITTTEALEELVGLVEEHRSAQRRRGELDLPPDGFGVYWLLHRDGILPAERIARQAAAAFARYPHWKTNTDQERQVRIALYKAFRDAGVENFSLVDRILHVLESAK